MANLNIYSKPSQENLDSSHIDLQGIFTDALQVMDHSIICGYRSEKEQLALYLEKKSKVRFGRHNSIPSMAIDAIPYPLTDPNDWSKDRDRMILFAGIVLAIAHRRGVKIRWGGDWDGDKDMSDQTFNDLVHFELEKRK